MNALNKSCVLKSFMSSFSNNIPLMVFRFKTGPPVPGDIAQGQFDISHAYIKTSDDGKAEGVKGKKYGIVIRCILLSRHCVFYI